MQERHYLAPLFNPDAVAIIGKQARPGADILRRLVAGGFRGEIHACGAFASTTAGCTPHLGVDELPLGIALAVLAVPLPEVPDLLVACGRRGVATVILPGGHAPGEDRAQIEADILSAAQDNCIRLLGPNALGIMRPRRALQASTAHIDAHAGSIALVSESSSLCRAILDWAHPNQIGFSTVVSLGTRLDIDFDDVLDFLISDPATRSIIVHVEQVRDARRFVSALRTAARIKPVMLLKSGRHASVAQLSLDDESSPGDDRVFNAAVSRCGAIRLHSLNQLFAAANALFAQIRPRGNRLAIITNGAGAGLMAADRAADLGVELARPGKQTVQALQTALDIEPRHINPLDLGSFTHTSAYVEAIRILARDADIDGLIVMLSPQSAEQPNELATALIAQREQVRKPLLACLLGEAHVQQARQQLRAAGIPTVRTPEPAVELFHHIHAYYRNQKLLVQVPGSVPDQAAPHLDAARMVLERALDEGREELDGLESKSCLSAFGIAITHTLRAHSATEAVMLAEQLGYPVALKAEVSRKGDIQPQPRLDLSNAAAVRRAFVDLASYRCASSDHAPQAPSLFVESMADRSDALALRLNLAQDPVFGPFLALAEQHESTDAAVALPPLNTYLAREMLAATGIPKLLSATGQPFGKTADAVRQVLLRVSEMVCELPEISTLEIAPLLVTHAGAVAVQARIHVHQRETDRERYSHMAIHPYPSHLVRRWTLPDGREVTLRPIRPEDAEMENVFVRGLTSESRYLRFMSGLQELSPAMLVRLTQIDYDREMAFVATTEEHGHEIELGVCRYATTADALSCEFAIVVDDAWQRHGIASKLMEMLIDTARRRGLQTMKGVFLARNQGMIRFAQRLGFEIAPDEDDPTLRIGSLRLQA